MPSDVEVFVRFEERCVFAGEDFHCVITFKNIATVHDASSNHAGQSGRNASHNYGHAPRRSISTSLPSKGRHVSSYSVNSPPLSIDTSKSTTPVRPGFKHQRSVSIVSINSPTSSTATNSAQPDGRTNAHFGHRRSSTVQVASDAVRRIGAVGRQSSADFHLAGRRSPLSAAPTPPEMKFSSPEFKFPAVESPEIPHSTQAHAAQNTSNLMVAQRPGHRPTVSTSHLSTLSDGPDAYNHSNHSGETLTSEQASILSERPPLHAPGQSLQRASSVVTRKSKPVTLLMGYAQVNATFTLDASLVDQTPFEEVKKKGFLGGQAGGGVVGVKKKTRPGSSLLGAFGFGSIGESLESIMGNDNLSSVKEMKAVTNARSIPLLSTPQSLLFVDLRLEPGEERSYSFVYRLPQGLPSSYRGKAIKINYNLVIGIQGAPGAKEMQAVRQINVPIRVFSGVDTDGEIFGHDLMQPHVVLRDVARTKLVTPSDDETALARSTNQSAETSSKEFLRYVGTLLERNRRRQSSVGTIDTIFAAGDTSASATTRAINRAVLLSNQIAASNDSSPNRFEIARSGLKIATVNLDRPLHRLGETITTVVDFTQSEMTCTSLRATLESAERVEDALAIRGASAISRISRKIYAAHSENILFSKRAVFCPTIPAHATPTFVTSGVSLDWYIKIEFGTVRAGVGSDGETAQKISLLEEIMKDERGTVNVAIEAVDCETFEVSIPITVYGDIVSDGKDIDEITGIPI